MQVRVKGKRRGIMCVQDEANLVTTPRRASVGFPFSYATHQPQSELSIFMGGTSLAVE